MTTPERPSADESFLFNELDPSHIVESLLDMKEVADRDAAKQASELFSEDDPRWANAYDVYREKAYNSLQDNRKAQDTGEHS